VAEDIKLCVLHLHCGNYYRPLISACWILSKFVSLEKKSGHFMAERTRYLIKFDLIPILGVAIATVKGRSM